MNRAHYLPGLQRLLATTVVALVISLSAFATEAVRLTDNIDSDWKFHKGDVSGAEIPGFNDSSWRTLDVPHDWSIEGPYDQNAPTGGPGGYLPTGVGWYRKQLVFSEAMRGRRITIRFDGVYMNSDVWLNGRLLGNRPYGYSVFTYDLTEHVKFGEPNTLAVRVDNSAQPNSRWYSGSGIYRHVWLTATNPIHVVDSGVQVTTPEISKERAAVRISARIANDSSARALLRVRARVTGPDGASLGTAETNTVVSGSSENVVELELSVKNPQLWGPRTPALHKLLLTVESAGAVVDDHETTFGIRSVVWDVDRGLLLNGEPVKLLGVCLHHDGGAVGAAVPEAVLERRLRLLQAMGANAVRCSHNPMAPEFYDLCDKLGLLVMDEAFDEWTMMKPQIKFGYSMYYREWYERDLAAMIRQNRNHPSIVIWSVGNEINEQQDSKGSDVLRPLVEICHREDPTRPVTAAMDRVFTDQGHAPEAFTALQDVVGYNYVDRWLDRREAYFAPDRTLHPKRRFVGTEDIGLGGVRGGYLFRAIPQGTPERALYASAPIRVEQLWKFALTHDYDTGHFMWTGIDYLGEARWPNKAASSGALDTCGFAKDSYYLFQSIFRSEPMLHLLPHWNWPGREGKVVPVLAYSNCDVVELTLNGRSLGAKAREFPRQGTRGGWNTYSKPQVSPTTADLHLAWDVPYEPGVLKATGWRNGEKVCEAEVRTAGPAAAVTIEADRADLRADGRDVAHLTVKVVDAQGTVVPGASQRVSFAVEGAGTLIGVDNGNPASHESFQATERQAFNGMCLGLIRTKTTPGEVRITVSAEGVAPATIALKSAAVSFPKPRILK